MNICNNCNSNNLVKWGKRNNKQVWKCKKCNKRSVHNKQESLKDKFKINDDVLKELLSKHKKFVITSAQNETETNTEFLNSLLVYCDENDAKLMVIPIRYNNPSAINKNSKNIWDENLKKYFIENTINLNNNIKIIADLNVEATAATPLTSLDPLTMGKSTIFGHGQLSMKTIPVNKNSHPIIITTTGSVSNNTNYSDSKAGYTAKFNHCNSAIVVEIENENDFHLRQLIADENNGFYDLDRYYSKDLVCYNEDGIEALITGDEHVINMDIDVINATYIENNSIVKILHPKYIIRHDVLDCYSISHHHNKSKFTKYFKNLNKHNSIKNELDITCKFINLTTPKNSKTIIVDSNHNNHLLRWLDENEPDNSSIENVYVYHKLWTLILENESVINPFKLWYQHYHKNDNVEFLDKDEKLYIKDILVSMHGDIGPNGSRGSRKNISKLSDKTVIGHSHSPGIEKGCYQVGTSSELSLDYNVGPSSWMHTHCIIHKNGKRQLINIIKGKWRI